MVNPTETIYSSTPPSQNVAGRFLILLQLENLLRAEVLIRATPSGNLRRNMIFVARQVAFFFSPRYKLALDQPRDWTLADCVGLNCMLIQKPDTTSDNKPTQVFE